MDFVKTVRSWSFPPPAYEDEEQQSPEVLTSSPPRRTRSSRLCSRWLMTFDKQWLLIHVLTTFLCFVVMFTSAAIFVTVDFDNFDEGKPAWLGAAFGMISTAATGGLFGALRKAYTPDPSKTPEQLSTNKFLITAVAVLVEVFIAILIVVVTGQLSGSYRMRLIRTAGKVAVTFCVIVAIYDIIKLVLDKSESFTSDQWQDDDELDDAEHIPSNGAVRLE